MPDIYSALESIAVERRNDALLPVTVIVPSHASGLQLRRRLAELVPFAAVRFETLPRVAELLAGGALAAAGRSPLARPIGDYVAEQVARESQGVLAGVAELPGYARALRLIFRRLRRGGIRRAEEAGALESTQAGEILRLYDRFREATAVFYDDEDLLDEAAATARDGRAGVLADLGALYVVPPGAQSAGADALLAALREVVPQYVDLGEPDCDPAASFVLAPDPASEAREVVREVLSALETGTPLHEIAVFHGADAAYPRLLREAFAAAGVVTVPLPGVPLIETRAGRGVLALALLPERDFSRTAAMEALSVAPVRARLPAGEEPVRALPAAWDRVSREAGITKDGNQWAGRLTALIADLDSSIQYHDGAGNEARANAARYDRDRARELRDVMDALIARLQPLCEPQPAASFIKSFTEAVKDYLDPEAHALTEVLDEIEQLGTVGAVGGSFSLATFGQALRANLEAAVIRPASLGEGVVVADYRLAAGLRFQRVILCGAYEGSLPSGPGSEVLLEDATWTRLGERHPLIEDKALRIERALESARRAVTAAGTGGVVWTAPLREPGGTREYYPSPLMRAAASRMDAGIVTAADLRGHAAAEDWLRRGQSPLAAMLTGPLTQRAEAAYRWAIGQRRRGDWFDQGNRHWPAVSMLRARRSRVFTVWDGNLSALEDESWLELRRAVSPTSLENYAECGFRYFARYLLGLNAIEEPEEREMMDAAARGSLIHKILERFFAAQRENGRPRPYEPWRDEDAALLMRFADEELAGAEERGLTGLDIYSRHEARTIKADLRRFLAEDTVFRQGTGAVPVQLEAPIPETQIAGVTLRGFVDRVDMTEDKKQAWVIDYKSGAARDYKEEITAEDPFARGRRLQLPTYLAAAREAEEARALYWFITQRGGFEFVRYDPPPGGEAAFERVLTAIVTGIRAGSFPAVPGEDNEYYGRFDNCRYCDYDRICSRRRDHEHAAKQGDELVAPWRNVGEVAVVDGQG